VVFCFTQTLTFIGDMGLATSLDFDAAMSKMTLREMCNLLQGTGAMCGRTREESRNYMLSHLKRMVAAGGMPLLESSLHLEHPWNLLPLYSQVMHIMQLSVSHASQPLPGNHPFMIELERNCTAVKLLLLITAARRYRSGLPSELWCLVVIEHNADEDDRVNQLLDDLASVGYSGGLF